MGRPNNGPRLRKEGKDGNYVIAWSENRRTKRVSTGTANLLEAQKVLAGFLVEQQRVSEMGARWTVGMVIDYYDENHAETDVVDKKRQRRALARIRASLGDDTFMDELASDDFTKYRAARKRAKGQKGKPINDATIRRELNSFLAAANFCVRNRKIENRHVPVVDLPDHNAGRDRWLTQEEFQTLHKAAQPEGANRLTPVYRFFALAVGTYRRRHAIETLKWFQVDFRSGIIDFRRPGEAETAKKRGIAAIPDWLMPILKRAYDEKISEYVLDDPYSLTRDIRAVCDAAGFPDVTAHTLRHTGGTWAAQGGASMWEIAGAMGCTIATAERNYLHHSPKHLRDVVNRVAVVINMPEAAGTKSGT